MSPVVHSVLDVHDPLHLLGASVLALGITMARWLGLTLMLPVFSRTGLTGLVRGGFSFAMAGPMLPVGLSAVEALDPSRLVTDIVLLGLKEMIVGLSLGIILGTPFWAIEMAGEFLDIQRGGGDTAQPDATGMNQSSVLGTFFAITSIALFLIGGGIDVIASAVYDSYRLWPLHTVVPTVADGTGEIIVGLLQKMMTIAVLVSAPLVIATVAADILLGLISKLAPQLNAYSMGAGLKSLILAILMPLYAVFFLGDLSATFGQLRSVVRSMGASLQ